MKVGRQALSQPCQMNSNQKRLNLPRAEPRKKPYSNQRKSPRGFPSTRSEGEDSQPEQRGKNFLHEGKGGGFQRGKPLSKGGGGGKELHRAARDYVLEKDVEKRKGRTRDQKGGDCVRRFEGRYRDSLANNPERNA